MIASQQAERRLAERRQHETADWLAVLERRHQDRRFQDGRSYEERAADNAAFWRECAAREAMHGID